MRVERIGDQRRASHLHRERTGIHARRLSANLTAIKQHNAHAAARQEQRRGAAHHASAYHGNVKARCHIGAGAGTGISA